MVIKNIVISGGGPSGCISYGAIKKLHEMKIWNHEELNAIYASSIGGFIGFLISFGFNWNIIDDYIIERPWIKAFDTIKTDILEIIYNNGINGEDFFSICTKPILAAKELPYNITLKQLYDITKIELCLTATELNCFEGLSTELISYRTYPDMNINCALACSCALPLIFKPIFHGDKCFIDGGIVNNLPLKLCLDDSKCNQNEIITFANKWNRKSLTINSNTSFIDYLRFIMLKIHREVDNTKVQPIIQNIIYLDIEDIVDISTWYGVLKSKDKRRDLINRGEIAADCFINSMFRRETVEDSQFEV